MKQDAKKPLYTLPMPSTELEPDPVLWGNEIRLRHKREGAVYRHGIRFSGVAATRTRAERCCRVRHIEDCYDTLAEVVDSPWVAEIREDTDVHWRDHWEMHHYIIYLDSAGCFELIAASFEVLPEERASL